MGSLFVELSFLSLIAGGSLLDWDFSPFWALLRHISILLRCLSFSECVLGCCGVDDTRGGLFLSLFPTEIYFLMLMVSVAPSLFPGLFFWNGVRVFDGFSVHCLFQFRRLLRMDGAGIFCGRGRFDSFRTYLMLVRHRGGVFSSFGGVVPGVISPVVVLHCGVRYAQ